MRFLFSISRHISSLRGSLTQRAIPCCGVIVIRILQMFITAHSLSLSLSLALDDKIRKLMLIFNRNSRTCLSVILYSPHGCDKSLWRTSAPNKCFFERIHWSISQKSDEYQINVDKKNHCMGRAWQFKIALKIVRGALPLSKNINKIQ